MASEVQPDDQRMYVIIIRCTWPVGMYLSMLRDLQFYMHEYAVEPLNLCTKDIEFWFQQVHLNTFLPVKRENLYIASKKNWS